HRSAVCATGRESAPGASGMGGADLQRVGSAAQSGQSLLDAASAGHIEIEGQGHRGIWSAAVDRPYTGRVFPVLAVCPLYSLLATHEIGLPSAGKLGSVFLGRQTRSPVPTTPSGECHVGSRFQSAGTGAGPATSAGAFTGPAVSAGDSSHLRTSGSARRIASSPTRINSPARLKSSKSKPPTSGSITTSAALLHTGLISSCEMANDCPITSKKCRGAIVFDHCPFNCTASTRSAPISRRGRVGTGQESMPSTSQRPRISTGRNIPGYAQLARTGSMIEPEEKTAPSPVLKSVAATPRGMRNSS